MHTKHCVPFSTPCRIPCNHGWILFDFAECATTHLHMAFEHVTAQSSITFEHITAQSQITFIKPNMHPFGMTKCMTTVKYLL